MVREQRGRLETIESELKDVRRRLGRLWDLPKTGQDDDMDNTTLRIKTNGERRRCLEAYIRAERLEELIWSEVKRVIQNPDLIVAGIDPLDSQESGGLEEQIAQAERDLRSIQTREGTRHHAVRVWEDHRGPTRRSTQVHHRAT